MGMTDGKSLHTSSPNKGKRPDDGVRVGSDRGLGAAAYVAQLDAQPG
jgi:hypothetical protein